MDVNDRLRILDDLFGNYKAEWLHEDIFSFFAAPGYLDAFKKRRPCVMIGGRGSGKTTVLRGLSYQGQFALNKDNINAFDENPYIGIYYRANTNHLSVFCGKGVPEEKWMSIFSHFINLIFASEILYFLSWHKEHAKDDEELSQHACQIIAASLHLSLRVLTFNELLSKVELALYEFQSSINNITDGIIPQLSMSGDPIKVTTEQVLQLRQFRGKYFFLLIDEYENFLVYQQMIINSLLKHVPESYTIKIGVREEGWKVKTTLNPEEILNDPADYVRFNIVEELTSEESGPPLFEDFAQRVCMLRLAKIYEEGLPFDNMEKAFSSVSIEEESLLLGVVEHDYCKKVEEYEYKHHIDLDVHPLYKFFLYYWSVKDNEELGSTIENFLNNRTKWNQRYENYRYSLLFKIKRGRGSGEISKYYAGWSTFVKMANGNIRYLMELCHRAYYQYLRKNGDIYRPIPLLYQTKAAKYIGWKHLTEIDGKNKKGAQLTRMVQSIGSVFGRLARDGDNLAPEVVQFELEGTVSERTQELLSLGVMYLALVRMSANKLSGKSDVKEFMYSLHPIFAPYFGYSFRKKRKMPISDKEFLLCVDNPSLGMLTILKRKNIVNNEKEDDSIQLDFFDIIDAND